MTIKEARTKLNEAFYAGELSTQDYDVLKAHLDIFCRDDPYEIAEKEGRLVGSDKRKILPVASGEPLYSIIKQKNEFKILYHEHGFSTDELLYILDDFGKTFFKTKEEAEEAIKKLEKEKENGRN